MKFLMTGNTRDGDSRHGVRLWRRPANCPRRGQESLKSPPVYKGARHFQQSSFSSSSSSLSSVTHTNAGPRAGDLLEIYPRNLRPLGFLADDMHAQHFISLCCSFKLLLRQIVSNGCWEKYRRFIPRFRFTFFFSFFIRLDLDPCST